jgi:hypothetical protein
VPLPSFSEPVQTALALLAIIPPVGDCEFGLIPCDAPLKIAWTLPGS